MFVYLFLLLSFYLLTCCIWQLVIKENLILSNAIVSHTVLTTCQVIVHIHFISSLHLESIIVINRLHLESIIARTGLRHKPTKSWLSAPGWSGALPFQKNKQEAVVHRQCATAGDTEQGRITFHCNNNDELWCTGAAGVRGTRCDSFPICISLEFYRLIIIY